MKRKIAFLLAVVLIVSAGFMAYATGSENGGPAMTATEPIAQPGETDDQALPEGAQRAAGTEAVQNPEDGAETGEAEEGQNPTGTQEPGSGQDVPESSGNEVPGNTEGMSVTSGDAVGSDTEVVAPANTGQIDVSIAAALVLEKTVGFTINLTTPSGEGRQETLELGNGSREESRVTFEGLSNGQYTLTVSAEGFATYTQVISVEGKGYAINLATGFLGGIDYVVGLAHPGVLVIGDVNGDGEANDTDRTALVDAIDRATRERSAVSGGFDLNGDGEVNLVDLEYFAKAYEDARDKQAGVEVSVPRSVIRTSAGKSTSVEGGSLDAVLNNSGSVTLKPADGGNISDENPVMLQFDFAKAEDAVQADGIVIETGADNPITKAVISIEYVDEDGITRTQDCPVLDNVRFLLKDSSVWAERDANGNIQLHLGGQVAVKRVTLTIKGTKNTNLAEISKVEFVNGMETRIPEPEMDIPTGMKAVPGSNMISMTWNACINVTGYEVAVAIVQEDGSLGQWETTIVAGNAYEVVSYNKDKLKNYQKYAVKVQSVNGTWRSGYGEAATVIPEPAGRPDKPDMVRATGQYKSIAISWKNMEDTEYYRLFYKKSSDAEYQEIGQRLTTNSYVIEGLEDLTEYMVYVIGGNGKGESGPSLTATATTTDLNPPVIPKYKLINTGEDGQVGAHITSAKMAVRDVASMEDSPKDEEPGTAWGTVDHDAASYYLINDWDDGVDYPGVNKGLTYEFDQAYEMDTIYFHAVDSTYGYARVRVQFWDAEGQLKTVGASLERKADSNNRTYYVVRLAEPITTNKLQLCVCTGYARKITVAEVYFYYYDSLYHDIMDLYQDDLHTVLKPEVNQGTIDALRIRIDTPDEVSGEKHPDSELLKRELDNAEQILYAELSDPVVVHNAITTKGVSNVGGLNVWQPLGVTAAAGEEIAVYVGHSTKKNGEDTELQLIATQYNAEADAMARTVISPLKIGRNTVQIPRIWSLDFESGGALYVQYTGSGTTSGQYAVRVSGGVQVPILDLYQVTDKDERLARTVAYVEKLKTYVSEMKNNHEKYHAESENQLINKYAYDEPTCILGASDIMLDTVMFSLPATQIWAGSGGNSGISIQEQAERLLQSMDSMEDMMYLFYQHKGLNKNAPEAANQIPAGHQNIRYQRMFAKAFMYASGNHIGIGWGSTAGMVASPGVVFDENGRYISGSQFGWGIAHEIGHCINQGAYAVAEITNNYFAVLAQAQDKKDTVRFQYDKVYEKVTSGAKGRATNVFTQLGLYWQLHLAYDNGYNFATYADYAEQLENLFFARVDTYARNTVKAPAPGGVSLTLESEEQNLMRLACAAAEKNILDFFQRWGMTPNETTIKYAEQFPEETRAIYYVNDDARVYRLENSGSMLGTDGAVGAVSDTVRAVVKEANRVDIELNFKNIPEADVLGYEIVRCTISGGDVVKTPVGFATGSTATFSDIVTTMNNRVVYYEVTLIDKYLNRSAVKELDPVKIEHDGSMDKTFWTVSTNNLTVADEEGSDGSSDDLHYCDPENDSAYEKEKDKLIDNLAETVFTAEANGTAEITLEFNQLLTVAGFKITAGAELSGTYEIQVRCDGIWRVVASGTAGKGVQTIHFENADGKYVSTYEATAAKLVLNTAAGTKVAIAELDVLGVTGDNVDFRRTEDDDRVVVIGKLSEDFRFGGNEGDVIPKGSIVFAGSYKGNAAYNVVILFDQDGNVVGRVSEDEVKSEQIILADVPDEGNILNVTDGIWIYWVDPQTDLSGIKKVRAELYRVNKAETNEGQRLVSDSLFEKIPDVLPEVTLDGVAEPWK